MTRPHHAHPLRNLVAQRLYGLYCGYEDLNDHDRLRHDPLMQTAAGKVEELGSSPTFSRLETGARRADIVALNRVLVEQFVAAQARPPRELILDVDASHVPLHGDQRTLYTEGFNRFVTSTIAPVATGRSDRCRAALAPAEKQRLGTAHETSGLGPTPADSHASAADTSRA